MRRHLALPVVALAAIAFAGCGRDAKAASPATTAGTAGTAGKVKVVTTVAPITSIAANIGGDKVAITGVVPEGTNSHTFEPVPSQAKVLAEADVIFINGLDLEDPTKKLAEDNKKSDTPIVELGSMTHPRERVHL